MDEKMHYVVATGIVIKDGKYLIAKRAEYEKAFPGFWTVPGGKLEQKDYKKRKQDTDAGQWYNIVEDLLRREVMEEVGLEIENIKYLTSLTFIRPDNIPAFVLSMFANYKSGGIHLGEGIIDYAWVTLEEAKNYRLIPGIYEEIEMLDKHLKGEKIGEWGKMQIIDSVYGDEEISEPVLIELINSKPLQRLKGISQYGLPDEYYHKKGYSRYDHSIGVLLLLRRLNANLKEQIAGLLHDVSHTAFSHVIDLALGDSTKEDYQDNNHLNFIRNSEIPKILEKYGFDFEEISDFDNFSLLEQPTPSLCADRVDYTLRELKKEGRDIDLFFLSLVNQDGRLVFKSREPAESFAHEYLRLQNEHWAEKEAKARYYILSNILKKALEKNIILFEDLYKTDMEVINKLILSSDPFILENLDLLKNRMKIKMVNAPEGILVKQKFRYINPEILMEKEIKQLSEISEEYKKRLNEEKQKSVIERRIIIMR